MNKMLVILLAALMTLSIAACGQAPITTPSPSPSAETETTPMTSVTATPPARRVVRILTEDFWGNEARQGSWYMNKLQALTGVEVEIEITRYPNNEQRMIHALMVDDQPEILWCMQLAWQYFATGRILDFTGDIPAKIPNLQKIMNEFPSFARDIKNNDGSIYILPNLIANSVAGAMPLFDKKFMDENSLEKPENFDELYTLLKKAQALGIEQPIWILASTEMFEYNYNAYHTKSVNQNNGWYLDPAGNNSQGKMVYAPVDDADKLKDMFAWTARAWKEGLCSSEDPRERSGIESIWRYLKSGKIFYFNSEWNDNDMWSTGGELGISFDYLGLIDGPYGPPRFFDDPHFETYGAMGAKSENKEEAFKLLNFIYSEEGSILHYWGAEGETYTTDANGNKQYMDAIRHPDPSIKTLEEARHQDWGMAIFKWPAWRQSDDFTLFHEQSQQFYKDKINAVNRMPAVPRFDFKDSDQKRRYDDLQILFRNEIVNAQFPAFIKGDKAFDQYVTEVIDEMMKNNNLNDYRAIVDENYEKWSKR